MKKLIAFFLLLSLLFGYTSCKGPDNDKSVTITPEDEEKNEIQNVISTIVVPTYKDYNRNTVDFDKLIYSRPNLQSVIDALNNAAATVNENTKTLSEQIEEICALESLIDNADTMYAMAEIYHSKDSSLEFWQSEYKYISTNYPSVTQAIENLVVACARSEHKTEFEEEYFGYSLDKYKNGGIYTDAVVNLMAEEARLEAEYSSLSTATVEIVYDSAVSNIRWAGTVDEVYAMAREHYKNDDSGYEKALLAINLLYENKLDELKVPIYIELLKVRRLIADELGYSSYRDLAYNSLGYDYSKENMLTLLDNIGTYVSPVASDLEYTVFQSYFNKNVQPTVSRTVLVNKLYEVYSSLGGDYSDAYSYMLQHKLYDIDNKSQNRFSGAFTTYLYTNSSPYLFMTSTGFIRDYTTLSHEFGHFLDGYINYGRSDSLAIAEISSQALELLTVLKLKNELHTSKYEYLEYFTLFTYLNSVLLVQSFYSAFEHMAYELNYEQITEEKLKKITENAFSLVYGENMSINGDLTYVTIPHTILYPFYVESYVSSALVSLDIFFKESYRTGNSGDGFAIYNTLINRENTDLSFEKRLEAAGLDSPFEEGKVKEISDNIYFQIAGKHYYKNSDNEIDAA